MASTPTKKTMGMVNTPVTSKTSRKRPIEEEATGENPFDGKSVTLNLGATFNNATGKQTGMKVEAVISPVNYESDREQVRKIMTYLEAKAVNIVKHEKWSASVFKCYPGGKEKPSGGKDTTYPDNSMVVFVKVGMPFDVKSMELLVKTVAPHFAYTLSFSNVEQAIEACNPFFNRAEYQIDGDQLKVFDRHGCYNITHLAKDELADCKPVFEPPNCWKYQNAEKAFNWYNKMQKCFFTELPKQGVITAIEVPDDF